MSDLFGNPEDRFSHDVAHILLSIFIIISPLSLIVVSNYFSFEPSAMGKTEIGSVNFYLVIMLTCSCNVHPLTPHFYIVKVGFTGVYIIFLFCSKT